MSKRVFVRRLWFDSARRSCAYRLHAFRPFCAMAASIRQSRICVEDVPGHLFDAHHSRVRSASSWKGGHCRRRLHARSLMALEEEDDRDGDFLQLTRPSGIGVPSSMLSWARIMAWLLM
eukprot:2340737-Pyramimonas_sp.AAC.1